MKIIRLSEEMFTKILHDLYNHNLLIEAAELVVGARDRDTAEDGPEVEILRQQGSNPCRLGS